MISIIIIIIIIRARPREKQKATEVEILWNRQAMTLKYNMKQTYKSKKLPKSRFYEI